MTLTIKKEINISYILGLFETDGSIQIDITEKKFKPMMSISQKTNSNLIPLVQMFLTDNGISSTIDISEGENARDRAPKLRIRGLDNIKKLIKVFKTVDGFVFFGAKYRDFLILKELINNNNLTDAQKIGLKLSLHKESSDSPETPLNKQTKSREHWEDYFGLERGVSITLSLSILAKIDKLYKNNSTAIKQQMQENLTIMDASRIAGLIDGDGCFTVSINPKISEKWVEWKGEFLLATEVASLLLVQAFKYSIGSNSEIESVKAKQGPLKGQVTSYKLWIRNQAEVLKIVLILDEYNLLGNYRIAEFNTITKLFDMKKDFSIRNREAVNYFIDEIYRVSAISKKGRPRKAITELHACLDKLNWE